MCAATKGLVTKGTTTSIDTITKFL